MRPRVRTFRILLALAPLVALLGTAPSAAQAWDRGLGVPPPFIDFDIGAATVRSGATHQANLTTSPPYVVFPNAGQPIALVNFTVPPDYADQGTIVARLLYTSGPAPCFAVLRVDLTGYGPGHSAALFDSFWPGSSTPSDEGIVTVPTGTPSTTHEVLVTLEPISGFPALPGDIMTFWVLRDAADVNDTCTNDLILRSISFQYEGILVFSDNLESGTTSRWN